MHVCNLRMPTVGSVVYPPQAHVVQAIEVAALELEQVDGRAAPPIRRRQDAASDSTDPNGGERFYEILSVSTSHAPSISPMPLAASGCLPKASRCSHVHGRQPKVVFGVRIGSRCEEQANTLRGRPRGSVRRAISATFSEYREQVQSSLIDSSCLAHVCTLLANHS